MLTVMADGRTLAERYGDGVGAVVGLHGWGRSGDDLAPVLQGLDALAPQLAGFGGADAPPAAWGTEEYAAALATALDGHAPVVLVGHSFGGRVAVRLAARRPELVRGVLLTGAPLLRLVDYKPRLGFRVIRWLAARRLVPQRVLDRARERYGSADYRAASGVMREVFTRVVREDYREDLERIVAPTRFVWGEHDDAAPVDAGRAAAALVPGATFRVVAGSGHLLDARLSAAIREELDELLAVTG